MGSEEATVVLETKISSVEENLLEAYPLNEYELKVLRELHAFHQESADFRFSNWLESQTEEAPHLETVRKVEETLVPPEVTSLLLTTALKSVIVLGCEEGDEEEELRRFLEAMVTCLGRRGPKSVIDLIVRASKGQDDKLLVYQLALASHALLQGPMNGELRSVDSAPAAWSTDEQSFTDWATWTAPQAYTTVSTFFHVSVFSPQHPFRPSTPPFQPPEMDKPSEMLKKSDIKRLAISLALMSPNLGGTWRRLYSSDSDACSFRTMQHALIGYRGPTVLLVRSTMGDVLGCCAGCPWKVSAKWFGEGSDSFLFTLHPKVALYPSTGQGNHHQYLNLPPAHRPQDLKGLAMGGISSDRPRLHITETFEKCRACSVDTSYASGPLIGDELAAYFDVDVIEVWATNETNETFASNTKKGSLQVAIREAARKQVASVDKGQFVDDFASGAYMNSVFRHRDSVSGRHELSGTSDSVRDFREHFDQPNESQHGK